MHWILLVVLAVILVITASRYPRLAFSMLGVLLVVAAGLYYLTEEEGQVQRATLEPASVEIVGIKMLPAYADAFGATGVIVNHSRTHDIRALSIRFTVNDCPEANTSELSDCTVISQVTEQIRIHVPLGGKQHFEQSVSPRSIKVSGKRRWTFKVVDVTGRIPLREINE